jgi:XTP/dITP diphosphohydrolase
LAALNVTLCSGNPGKLIEMQEALPEWSIEPLGATGYPVEDGATYLDNARIKARFGREVGPADRWMLADDSGIELSALGGAPGVQTARWAEGKHVEKTLAALAGQSDRRARYVAELVLLAPDGREVRGTGVLEGTIAATPAGNGGFGFDPVLIPRGQTRTVAELGDAWKAEHSHRALAAHDLLAQLAGEPGRV